MFRISFSFIRFSIVILSLLFSNSYLYTEETSSEEADTSMAIEATDKEPKALTGYDDGFFVRSSDGSNKLIFEGLFQVVGVFFDSCRDPRADFELKRMRLEFGGRLAKALLFKVETKFLEDGVELEEAWLGPELFGGNARLMIGRMKSPFNLEEVRSRRHIDFPRFSILNQFAPAEDHGLFVYGRTASKFWEYNFAVYNGTGSSDTNSSKDVAGRIMVHPFAKNTDQAMHNLQLGIAGTWGSQDEDVSGDDITNAADYPVIYFARGARMDGRRYRLGLEGAWFKGPWFVQSEAIIVRQEMTDEEHQADVSFWGTYLTLAYVITGESKSFAGVVPERPFDFSSMSGRGAWVAAMRVSYLDIDKVLLRQELVVPETFTKDIKSISFTLNWIANAHFILRNSFIQSFYSDDVLLENGTCDNEYTFLIETQLHF